MDHFSVDLARAEHRERTRRLQHPIMPEHRLRRRTAHQLRRLARVIEPSA